MVSKTVKVVNAQGMHMRPAGMLVAEMKKFLGCNTVLKVNGKEVKATAVMQIMAAGIKCGSEVEIVCDGEGEQEALDAAAGMFESGFGE